MVNEPWKEKMGNVCVPQRYIFGVMGFLGVAMAYIMRACLSIAITEMVISQPVNESAHSQEYCPVPSSGNSTSGGGNSKGEFDWSEEVQGLILSSFYWGYIITHIPGGLISEKFGGKHTMGLGILSTAVFTLLTPIVAQQGATPLIVLRFLMGLGEGTTFPALSTMLAQWAPPLERSKLAALVFAGVQMGTVISNALSGLILGVAPWESVFYIYGCTGIVWFILWCILCYNDPSCHPFISKKEKDYLEKTIGETQRKKDLGGTPWKEMLLSPPLWAVTIAEIGHDYGLFTMVTDLPKYMSDVMHFDISSNGFLTALPYLVMWFASLGVGYLADAIITRQWMTLTRLRIVFGTIGAIGPAIGVVAASYAGCDKVAVCVLFTVGMGFMGFCYASLRVNALDLSPNFAGTIMAIVNGSGSISGMVAPYVIGVLTPNRSLNEWRTVFWVMFGVLVGTNCVFMVFGSGEVQEWNEPISSSEAKPSPRRRSTITGGEPIREKYKAYYENSLPTISSSELELKE